MTSTFKLDLDKDKVTMSNMYVKSRFVRLLWSVRKHTHRPERVLYVATKAIVNTKQATQCALTGERISERVWRRRLQLSTPESKRDQQSMLYTQHTHTQPLYRIITNTVYRYSLHANRQTCHRLSLSHLLQRFKNC